MTPRKPRKPVPMRPLYVRLTRSQRAALDERCRAERRTAQAIGEAALDAYLSTPVTQ